MFAQGLQGTDRMACHLEAILLPITNSAFSFRARATTATPDLSLISGPPSRSTKTRTRPRPSNGRPRSNPKEVSCRLSLSVPAISAGPWRKRRLTGASGALPLVNKSRRKNRRTFVIMLWDLSMASMFPFSWKKTTVTIRMSHFRPLFRHIPFGET